MNWYRVISVAGVSGAPSLGYGRPPRTTGGRHNALQAPCWWLCWRWAVSAQLCLLNCLTWTNLANLTIAIFFWLAIILYPLSLLKSSLSSLLDILLGVALCWWVALLSAHSEARLGGGERWANTNGRRWHPLHTVSEVRLEYTIPAATKLRYWSDFPHFFMNREHKNTKDDIMIVSEHFFHTSDSLHWLKLICGICFHWFPSNWLIANQEMQWAG